MKYTGLWLFFSLFSRQGKNHSQNPGQDKDDGKGIDTHVSPDVVPQTPHDVKYNANNEDDKGSDGVRIEVS
jgi:hypothetical protein